MCRVLVSLCLAGFLMKSIPCLVGCRDTYHVIFHFQHPIRAIMETKDNYSTLVVLDRIWRYKVCHDDRVITFGVIVSVLNC